MAQETRFARDFRALHGHSPGRFRVRPAKAIQIDISTTRPGRHAGPHRQRYGVPLIGKIGLLVVLAILWMLLAAALVALFGLFGLFIWSWFQS